MAKERKCYYLTENMTLMITFNGTNTLEKVKLNISFQQLEILLNWKSLYTERTATFIIFYISFYHIRKANHFYESLSSLHDILLRNHLVEILEDTISTFRKSVCALPDLKLKSISSIYYHNQDPPNLFAVNIRFFRIRYGLILLCS